MVNEQGVASALSGKGNQIERNEEDGPFSRNQAVMAAITPTEPSKILAKSHRTKVRTMTPKHLVASILLALTLIAAGCGGSDGGERDQALVDALTNDILSDSDPFTSDADEARCVGEGTYDALGADRLAELGITVNSPNPDDADLNRDDATGVIDAIFDCVDMKAGFATSIEGDGVTSEQANCVADEFGNDGLKELFIDSLVAADDEGPTDAFIASFTEAAAECGL